MPSLKSAAFSAGAFASSCEHSAPSDFAREQGHDGVFDAPLSGDEVELRLASSVRPTLTKPYRSIASATTMVGTTVIPLPSVATILARAASSDSPTTNGSTLNARNHFSRSRRNAVFWVGRSIRADRKQAGDELAVAPPVEALTRFIEAELPRFEALNEPDNAAGEVEELNGFFRRYPLAA